VIEQDKVYTFANGYVKMANKKFSKVNNDYCVNFGNSAVIKLAADDGSINKKSFDFTSISDIESTSLRTVDVIGVVTEVSEQSSITLKSGESKNKRTVTIVDRSSCTVTITLWGDLSAAPVPIAEGQVLAVKAARITDFRGKSLNGADKASNLFVNPAVPEVQRLQEWISEQNPEEFRSLTQAPVERSEAKASQASSSKNNLNLLAEIKNNSEEDSFFFVNGYVQRIANDDKLYYNACPGDRCGRKVMDEGRGFHCENCQRTYPNCNPTYMMNARLSDFSDSMYVNFAREQGTALMGISAADLKNLREQQPEEDQEAFFESLNFKEVNVMIRGKPDFYNGEARMKYYAVKVLPASVKA
jgi:replication factor A1